MNKKLLGIALITASALTFSACSSDDDDDSLIDNVTDTVDETVDEVTDTVDETTDEVTDTVDETTDEVTDTVDETTDPVDEVTTGELPIDPDTGLTPLGYTPGSIQAAVEATGNVVGLNSLKTLGFDTALDDNTWTVFLPTDAALADAGVTEIPNEIAQKHINVTGQFLAENVVGIIGNDPSGLSGNDGTPWVFGGGANGEAVTVNGVDIVQTDLVGDSGSAIHLINGIIE